MDIIFTTDDYRPKQRYAAWREAICDVYVHVDVRATRPGEYRGFIREAKFGKVVLTDILLSEQRIQRSSRHIARLDKDCYYLQLIYSGNIDVIQRDATHRSNAARGALFCATEEYELRCKGDVRSFYLEIPRAEFAERFPKERIPVSAPINTTRGLGRIATEFCATLAAEGSKLDENARAYLGEQLMDMLALTLLSSEGDLPAAEGSVRQARLRAVQRWIEAHISDPDLSLEKIAAANGISLRYLHLLFRQSKMSASEWIWNRRLELCYDRIAKGDGQSITAIAFEHGFNSSAHFSTLFRRKYGVPPRDIARPGR
ncbi:MAG: helix-turn-helix domain-containing protein [Acidobacteriia bacterium]|nr:helix-turn-helix domain-containing protein [Methyloceanibacter sp.]MBX5471185.1 helix-turn-helix domain-containing protein [Acetobacteraceae bacterium]MCL6492496.1 helix-turn-helix domain-containing protein [Terriglobia bacterium]